MQYSPRLLALLTAAALATAPAFAAEDKKAAETTAAAAPAATKPVVVNGVTISAETIDTFMKMQLARGAPNTDELRQKIIDSLINQQVLVQEAKRIKLDKDPDVATQLELAQQGVLANAYVNDYLKKHPVTDEAIKAQYEKIKEAVSGDEYSARHILVDDEKAAVDIIAKIGKGEKFEDLAKAHSKDPGSKESGGDLGWSPAAAYVPPFGEALKKLKKGELTKEPVKTDFGYHIIELIDVRPTTPPSMEQVKPQLEGAAKREVIDNLLKNLQEKAKIEK